MRTIYASTATTPPMDSLVMKGGRTLEGEVNPLHAVGAGGCPHQPLVNTPDVVIVHAGKETDWIARKKIIHTDRTSDNEREREMKRSDCGQIEEEISYYFTFSVHVHVWYSFIKEAGIGPLT